MWNLWYFGQGQGFAHFVSRRWVRELRSLNDAYQLSLWCVSLSQWLALGPLPELTPLPVELVPPSNQRPLWGKYMEAMNQAWPTNGPRAVCSQG